MNYRKTRPQREVWFQQSDIVTNRRAPPSRRNITLTFELSQNKPAPRGVAPTERYCDVWKGAAEPSKAYIEM
jgi:hypothetical protein